MVGDRVSGYFYRKNSKQKRKHFLQSISVLLFPCHIINILLSPSYSYPAYTLSSSKFKSHTSQENGDRSDEKDEEGDESRQNTRKSSLTPRSSSRSAARYARKSAGGKPRTKIISPTIMEPIRKAVEDRVNRGNLRLLMQVATNLSARIYCSANAMSRNLSVHQSEKSYCLFSQSEKNNCLFSQSENRRHCLFRWR